jgi:hypothetical protein
MIYLLAPNYREAHYWCSHQDPPLNPRGRDVCIVASVDSCLRLLGRKINPGDRVVIYNERNCESRTAIMFYQELHRMQIHLDKEMKVEYEG